MSAQFNDREKSLLDNNKLEHYYPNSGLLEKYLIDESTTSNSKFTLALFNTENGKFVLPITSRQYGNRTVSELYHSEFFKTQYSKINRIMNITDLKDPSVSWRPILIDNSRVTLNLNCNDAESILYSKSDIKRYLKKYPLETCDIIDGSLITATVNRFNIENLGSTTNECVEYDIYQTRCDSTRRYFSLATPQGEHRSIVELQVEIRNYKLVVHYVNTYYIKDERSLKERTGLNSYYNVVLLASNIAKEIGYEDFTIDFGLIFRFRYKLQIPGSFLAGTTLAFIKG
jgi:hypothetical protein